MAFKHVTAGAELTQAEWEATGMHEIDGSPAGDVIVVTVPPSEKKKITNMYWDPVTGDLYVQVED